MCQSKERINSKYYLCSVQACVCVRVLAWSTAMLMSYIVYMCIIYSYSQSMSVVKVICYLIRPERKFLQHWLMLSKHVHHLVSNSAGFPQYSGYCLIRNAFNSINFVFERAGCSLHPATVELFKISFPK